jgi:hypothetical protein
VRDRFAARGLLQFTGVTPCDQERISLTRRSQGVTKPREEIVNGLIYLIGLIVVILFILSFLGLR